MRRGRARRSHCPTSCSSACAASGTAVGRRPFATASCCCRRWRCCCRRCSRAKRPGSGPALALCAGSPRSRRRSRSSIWCIRPGPTASPTAPAGCSTSSRATSPVDLVRLLPSMVRPRPATWIVPLALSLAVIALAGSVEEPRAVRDLAQCGRGAAPLALLGGRPAARLERPPGRRCPAPPDLAHRVRGRLGDLTSAARSFPERWTADRTRFDGGWALRPDTSSRAIPVAGGRPAASRLRVLPAGEPGGPADARGACRRAARRGFAAAAGRERPGERGGGGAVAPRAPLGDARTGPFAFAAASAALPRRRSGRPRGAQFRRARSRRGHLEWRDAPGALSARSSLARPLALAERDARRAARRARRMARGAHLGAPGRRTGAGALRSRGNISFSCRRAAGFAAAANLGLAAADPTSAAIAIVNDDLVVAPGWLAALIGELARRPRAAAVQGVQLEIDRPQVVEGCGLGWNRSWQAVQVGAGEPPPPLTAPPFELFGVSATAALYRRAALAAVAGTAASFFDERLGSYYEDVELAVRLREAEWESWCVPAAVARHAGQATTGRAPLRALASRSIATVCWSCGASSAADSPPPCRGSPPATLRDLLRAALRLDLARALGVRHRLEHGAAAARGLLAAPRAAGNRARPRCRRALPDRLRRRDDDRSSRPSSSPGARPTMWPSSSPRGRVTAVSSSSSSTRTATCRSVSQAWERSPRASGCSRPAAISALPAARISAPTQPAPNTCSSSIPTPALKRDALEALRLAFDHWPQAAGLVPRLIGFDGAEQAGWQLRRLPTAARAPGACAVLESRQPETPANRLRARRSSNRQRRRSRCAAASSKRSTVSTSATFPPGSRMSTSRDDWPIAANGCSIFRRRSAVIAREARSAHWAMAAFLAAYDRNLCRYLDQHHGHGWSLAFRALAGPAALARLLLLPLRRPARAASRAEAARALLEVARGSLSGWAHRGAIGSRRSRRREAAAGRAARRHARLRRRPARGLAAVARLDPVPSRARRRRLRERGRERRRGAPERPRRRFRRASRRCRRTSVSPVA